MTCPCGGLPEGASYDECCGPLLARQRHAETPEELMRSRYTAFVVGDGDHLFRTWHPSTRPDDLDVAPDPGWRGLRIIDAPEPTEHHGEVEFEAVHDRHPTHERSRFEKRANRWFYVDGDVG